MLIRADVFIAIIFDRNEMQKQKETTNEVNKMIEKNMRN